jgi:recombinational DNA repair ATPase RecF
LIRFDQDGFFIQANVLCNQAPPEETISDHTTFENECDEIQIGSTSKKRIVKINGKQISSFSEFSTNLKVVSLAECDMQLVQGSPECRRSFIDQYVFLHNPSFADELQKYRATLKQRNALFQYSFDQTGYDIWTRKLWQLALSIQKQRTKYLSQLTKTINLLQKACDFSIPISMPYRSKRKLQATVEEFMAQNPTLQEDEIGYQRTLFGTHLDDFIIMFNGRNSRLFASRGQQKLILILSKIAQIRDLHNKDIGKLQEKLQLKESVEEGVNIRFYAPYLLTGLQALPGDEVTFWLQSKSRPIIFEAQDNDAHMIYLVMPVSPVNNG